MLKVTSLNWQEPVAYGSACIALALGIFAGYFNHPDWLGRAGSIIIVIGVLLATSRKIDTLHRSALNFFDNQRPLTRKVVRDALEQRNGQEPSETEVDAMVDDVHSSAKRDTVPIIEDRRRIFKLHEVGLVVTGTLVNGFGPWLVGLFRCAA